MMTLLGGEMVGGEMVSWWRVSWLVAKLPGGEMTGNP